MSRFGSAIEAARAAGHVNLHGDALKEVMELSAASKEEKAKHAATVLSFEVKKRARSVVVPTSVEDIMSMLRCFGQPITLFGEGPYDRRERLRENMAAAEMEVESSSSSGVSTAATTTTVGAEEKKEEEEEEEHQQRGKFVYTTAPAELVRARSSMAAFSFTRAQERLQAQAALTADTDLSRAEAGAKEQRVQGTLSCLRQASLQASGNPESRPLVKLRCAPHGGRLVTGSLGCHATVWQVHEEAGPGCDGHSSSSSHSLQPVASLLLEGHRERLLALSWHPQAFAASGSAAVLATSGADGRCMLWDCMPDGGSSAAAPTAAAVPALAPVRVLEGHSGPVTDCEFHPSGLAVLTAGADYSWRMWDAESGTCLLLQDGHTQECSALACQADGALVMTCDAGGVVLAWDLRSGQRVASFPGHVEKVTSCSFSPNGYSAATASVDNMVRIWDLRYGRSSYMLPAHSSAITCARYDPTGEALLTTSFDGTVKLWDTRSHSLLSQLQGHSGKVMAADFMHSPTQRTGGGPLVASAGFDRTVKLWK